MWSSALLLNSLDILIYVLAGQIKQFRWKLLNLERDSNFWLSTKHDTSTLLTRWLSSIQQYPASSSLWTTSTATGHVDGLPSSNGYLTFDCEEYSILTAHRCSCTHLWRRHSLSFICSYQLWKYNSWIVRTHTCIYSLLIYDSPATHGSTSEYFCWCLDVLRLSIFWSRATKVLAEKGFYVRTLVAQLLNYLLTRLNRNSGIGSIPQPGILLVVLSEARSILVLWSLVESSITFSVHSISRSIFEMFVSCLPQDLAPWRHGQPICG